MSLIEHVRTIPACKFAVALATALLFAVTPARAGDHLEPEDSILGGSEVLRQYDDIVVGVLKDAYANDVVARMVMLPSSHQELAVGLRKTDDGYSIFALMPATPLSVYWAIASFEDQTDANGKPAPDTETADALRKEVPADWHAVKVNRCEVAVDPALGARIVDAWGKMLLETAYPAPGDKVVGVDGDFFHFYSYGKAGQIWSPAGGKTGALVDIGYAMANYCGAPQGKKKAALANLAARTGRLLNMIDPEKYETAKPDKTR